MKITHFVIISTIIFLGCTETNNKNNFAQNADFSTEFVDAILYKPAIIEGQILNQEVYPNIKELKLTIPGFSGDVMIYTAEISESGRFRFEFYPKTKREINLSSIEDVMVMQPGDSLFIVKDFKDIGNTIFYGDCAILNREISKFSGKYLGRYPSDYQQPYMDFKKNCEQKKADSYVRLNDYVQECNCSDDFINWANKQIELDFYKALFKYERQHFRRTNNELIDSAEYFSFIKRIEENIDGSIVLADYFHIVDQFVSFKLFDIDEKYRQNIEREDTIFGLLIEDVFSLTDNNYLAQFSLRSLLNGTLNANSTSWIDEFSEQIESKISDPFIRNNLKEHYNKVNEFNKNPKLFTDVILKDKYDLEMNSKISLHPQSENNIVKELVAKNNGKVILVDFWAPWCPPCIRSMEYSKLLIKEFENKEVLFAFICVNSSKELWKNKIDELNIKGEHIFCDSEATRAIRQRFGFSGIPYYLLIDKEGSIVDFGYHLSPRGEYVKSEIENLLNK